MLYKDITKYMHNYFWRVFHSNGWSHKFPADFDRDKEQEDLYEMTILEEYQCTVTAHVVTDARSLKINGEYGVMWINVEYEYNDEDGHSWSELNEMQDAIIDAEENLVKIGIPFESDYEFHGKNRANLKRKNDALIRKLNLKEKAEHDNKEYAETKRKYEEQRKEREKQSGMRKEGDHGDQTGRGDDNT